MLGIEAFLEILAAANVRYIFGNPGSTELPLNDALVKDSRFQYIFGLQEVPLTAMADGYAMASGGLGVVCVHICCGLGNAMGMLYNAFCEGTPLLLLAGQQDRRLRLGEPVLEGDMVSVTRPWTKWSFEVQCVEDVPIATRRAVQVALTPLPVRYFCRCLWMSSLKTLMGSTLPLLISLIGEFVLHWMPCTRPPEFWLRPKIQRSWRAAE